MHKPGIRVSGSHHGVMYKPELLDSPTLTRYVLKRRDITVKIDDNGSRETPPSEEARIFALGDSFTFGWGVNLEK